MLGPAGEVTGLCRAAAPHPSVCCWHTAPTTRQPGKPCKGEGATETAGSCCVSQKMPMGSVRQRVKAETASYLAVQRPANQLRREGIAPGSLQGLGTSWQRQERRQLYFSTASQQSTTFLGLLYLPWAHHKKVLHFSNLDVCTAEHEPPLWEITTGQKQRYMSQRLQQQ